MIDASGAPMAALNVLVPGHALVQTDAQGKFTVTSVSMPYDLVFALTDGGAGEVVHGLNKAAVTVTAPWTRQPIDDIQFNTSLAPRLSSENPATNLVLVGFTRDDHDLRYAGCGDSACQVTVEVNPDGGSSGTLAVLTAEENVNSQGIDGGPITFFEFGSASLLSVEATSLGSWIDVQTSPVTTSLLSVRSPMPLGDAGTMIVEGTFNTVDGPVVSLPTLTYSTDVVTYAVPVSPVGSAKLSVNIVPNPSCITRASGLVPATDGTVLAQVITPPESISPGFIAASVDPNAPLKWTGDAHADTGYLVLLTGGNALWVSSMEPEVQLPDLTPVGMQLAHGIMYREAIWALPGIHSPEETSEVPLKNNVIGPSFGTRSCPRRGSCRSRGATTTSTLRPRSLSG